MLHQRSDAQQKQQNSVYVLTAIHGAKVYWMPVARTSRAVASPILFTRSGSLEAQERQDEYIYQHILIILLDLLANKKQVYATKCMLVLEHCIHQATFYFKLIKNLDKTCSQKTREKKLLPSRRHVGCLSYCKRVVHRWSNTHLAAPSPMLWGNNVAL